MVNAKELRPKELVDMPQIEKKAKSKSKSKPKPKWVPICKIGGAYDFDEKTGLYSESMNKIEIQQEIHSKVVRAVIIKD